MTNKIMNSKEKIKATAVLRLRITWAKDLPYVKRLFYETTIEEKHWKRDSVRCERMRAHIASCEQKDKEYARTVDLSPMLEYSGPYLSARRDPRQRRRDRERT